MVRTVIITGAIAFPILMVVLLFAFFGGTGPNTEYLKFAIALLVLLAILVGSYWFVYVPGGGREEE